MEKKRLDQSRYARSEEADWGLEESVVSSCECTGMIPTPPDCEAQAEAYIHLYPIPKPNPQPSTQKKRTNKK